MRSVNRFHERASGWLVVALCAFLPLMSGCINVDLLGAGGGPLVEETLDGDGGDKILLVEISGVIDDGRRQESIFGSDAAATVFDVRAVLDEARDDDDIRAVLLRIDSPGGRATASDLIHEEITRFKQERSVPVFAQLMGVAASGGYYVAVAADEIVAHPTTITGSIGVIFQGFNAAGLIDKIGVEDQTIVSGERKDAGSPLRRMSADERAMMQAAGRHAARSLRARRRRGAPRARPRLGLEARGRRCLLRRGSAVGGPRRCGRFTARDGRAPESARRPR